MKATAHSHLEPLEARIAPAAFIVSTLVDSGAGSLRQAIDDANASPGADEIFFEKAPGVPLKGSIKLTMDLPTITDDLSIYGPVPGSARGISLDGMKQYSVFEVSGASFLLRDATVKNGLNLDGGAIAVDAAGETTFLDNVLLTANRAASPAGDPSQGGAIFVNAGSLEITNSVITGNRAAGIDGAMGNPPGSASGGAISTAGFTIISSSTISGNVAKAGNGEKASGDRGSDAFGGGIFVDGAVSSLIVTNSTVSKNSAIGGNGAAGGPGQNGEAAGSGQGGGLYAFNSGSVTVSSSNVVGNVSQGGTGGKAGGPGLLGGNGSSSWGGGISIGGGTSGLFTLFESQVTGNKALGGKGGGSGGTAGYGVGGGLHITDPASIDVSTISGNSSGVGGGIFANDTTAITDSTIAKNKSEFGGGIYHFSGAVTLSNVTISSNSASKDGGGIWQVSGALDISTSTITKNTARGDGGGIWASGGTASLVSVIVAGNKGVPNPDLSGSFNATNCLIGIVSIGTNLPTNVDNLAFFNPQLGPLKLNGGPTATHLPKSTSPVIDTGLNPNALAFDQRGTGFSRTFGGLTDIGSVEVQ